MQRVTFLDSDDHMQISVKCLPKREVDAIDKQSETGRNIVESADRKVAHNYVPPFAVAERINADQAMGVTRYELIADIGNIEPSATIYGELNCEGRMMRELSLSVRLNGKISPVNEPHEWMYMSPGSNGAVLLKLVCLKRSGRNSLVAAHQHGRESAAIGEAGGTTAC